MNVEFEEFDTIEEIFLYMACVASPMKNILVNIFAGINRCDWVAEGIVQALQKIEINMPLVIRLAGTNVEKGNKILKERKINYIEASTLEDAANKAVVIPTIVIKD